MLYKEVRAFSKLPRTLGQREVSRLQHPYRLNVRSKMKKELEQRGLTPEQSEERVDLRMMLHTDPRIVKLATPITHLSKEDIVRSLKETRGLLL